MKKTCTKCEKSKDLQEGFYNNSRAKDGKTSRCKSCTTEDIRAYISTPAGRARFYESMRKYQKTEKGRAATARYEATPARKEKKRKAARARAERLKKEREANA